MASGNVAAALRFLRSKGLSPAQAAGVVGSMQGESGPNLDPHARNPSSGAIGIAQWLGPRARGVRAGDLNQQLNHLWHELNTTERGALTALKGTHDPSAAAVAWQRAYERGAPFEQKYSLRAANARKLLGAAKGVGGAVSRSETGNTPTVAITGKVTPSANRPSFQAAAEEVLRQGAKHGLPKLGTSRLAQAQQLFKSGLATAPTDTQVSETIRTTKGSTPAAGGSSGKPVGKGLVNFEGTPVAAWIAAELRYARANGWKGKVHSGHRSYAEQARIYASGVRPAAKPGTSNHEGTDFPRGAVDVDQAAQLSAILAKKPGGSPLKWAGAKDPVHFSHPHGGSY